MTRDIEDAIQSRARGIRSYIMEVGSINTETMSGGATVIDFFLGSEDASAFERFDNGNFGGTVVIDDGMVVKSTFRVSVVDNDTEVADPFLLSVRLEELVNRTSPPDGIEVDVGDFDQGVPHIRFDIGWDPSKQPGPDALSQDEFGRFMVRAVEEIRDNADRLAAIATGDEVAL